MRLTENQKKEFNGRVQSFAVAPTRIAKFVTGTATANGTLLPVVGKRPPAARLLADLANSTCCQGIFADAAKIEPEAPETSGPSAIPINGFGFFLRSLRWRSVHRPAPDGEERAQRQGGAAQDVPVAGDGLEIHEGLRWNAHVRFSGAAGRLRVCSARLRSAFPSSGGRCSSRHLLDLSCRVDGGSDVFPSHLVELASGNCMLEKLAWHGSN